MTHCENCPRPGLKDMFDAADSKKQRQMTPSFEGCAQCPLADGCYTIFRDALGVTPEKWEWVKRREGQIKDFDNEY